MSDPIRCSSCDTAVDRVFVHGKRLRASCARCAFQFDVRCLACRRPLDDADDGEPIGGRCDCGEAFRVVGSLIERVAGFDKPRRSRTAEGLFVQMEVEAAASATYREGATASTLTVMVDDPEREARWSAYLAARAAFERRRQDMTREAAIIVGVLALMAIAGAMVAPSVLVIPLAAVIAGMIYIVRQILTVESAQRSGRTSDLVAPRPPARRGGAARISEERIELRDDAGAWRRAPLDPRKVRRVRVHRQETAYAVRVHTDRDGGLTLVEGLPEERDAADIAERVEAHLTRLARPGESG